MRHSTLRQTLLASLLSVGVALNVAAGTYSSQTFTNAFQDGGVIPDGSLNGWSDTRMVTGAGTHHVADVRVTLAISNGFNADLYAYLVHSNGMAVLLNRVGVSSTNAFGYSNAGVNITLSAAAGNDVHFYQNFSPSYDGNGWLTGTWKPDARGIDPLSAGSSFDAAGTTNFSNFLNQNPNGEWTLFVADVSAGGGQSTVISWGLQIDSVTEPPTNLYITSVNGGSSPTAGTPFSVVIEARDVNGTAANVSADTAVTLSLKSGDGTLAGTLSGTITNGTSSVTISGVTYSRAQSGVALTATRTSGNNLNAGDSSTFTVNPGAFAKLQLLMPGETAAPGSESGKTGSPSARTAGSAFNVTVNAVDANWNVVSSVTDTVGITSSDSYATLPSNAALVSGTKTFSVTLNTAGSATVTATDITDGDKTPSTSPSTTVNVGAFVKLQLLMPGETAVPGSGSGKTGSPSARTAGSSFNVTVNVVDANWNVVSSVTDTVGITSSDSYATLPNNAALVSGTKTFSVTLNTAGSATVTATDITDGDKTPSTSPSTTVNVGAFAKLQLLMPGESAVPGSGSGKTGSPSARTAGSAFNVTVNAVDANWNVVSSVTDTVGITSSDSYATLPNNAALVSGTKTFSVTLNTAGSATVTATDITDGDKTPSTSPWTTVRAGGFARLQLLMPGETAVPGSGSGKTGSPTDRTAGSAFNFTVNAVDANWNVVSSVTDTVGITSSDSYATLPNNAALVSGTKTFSVTLITAGSATVTATDITDGDKTPSTSPWTTVRAGGFARLQLLMPGETAVPGSESGKSGSPSARTAGSAFNVTVNAVDANWNLIGTNDTVAITSTDNNATLPANAALVAGSKTFSVTLNTAGSARVTAVDDTHPGIVPDTSPLVTVNVGASTKLQVLMPGETAAPGSPTGKTGTPTALTVGVTTNVTVNAVDANWNLISTNDTVHITSSDTNASLPSDAALVAGTGSFSLTFFTAGNQTVTASNVTHSGISPDTGTATTVNAGDQTITFNSPGDQTYGVAPITLTGTASSGLTVSYSVVTGPATVDGNSLTLTGSGSVTVRASQAGNANWNAATPVDRNFTVNAKSVIPSITANNKVYDGTTAATIASRNLTGVVGGDAVSLTGGTATFASANVGNGITVIATGLSLSGACATNYSLAYTSATNTANITEATVTITSGLSIANKVYDGSTSATLVSNTVVLSGVLEADVANVALPTNGYTATFATATVGNGKSVTVSGLTLTGSKAANYTLTQPAGLTANITEATVTITSGLSIANKVYDGSTSATLVSNTVVLSGVIEADAANVALPTNGYTATFATATVGNGKSVTVSGLTLTGSKAANYTLTQPAGLTANITEATVTITSGLSIANKVYDGSTSATLVSNTVVLSGVLEADAANVILSTNNYTATFATATVGNGKSVTVSGLTLTGSKAANYTLTQPVGLTANITAGPVAQLAFTTQPGSAAAGAPFGQQPVVKTQDQYGNDSVSGLAANLTVTVTLTSGAGPLQGTATIDIGTNAGNGTVSFTNLRIDPAGTKQLTASASGLTSAVSTSFDVPNAGPLAGTATFPRPRNVPLKILISNLLTNASDPNGDTLTLVGVSATSTNGATLYTNGAYVLYSLPPSGNVTDRFTYTVSDGILTTNGTVVITIQAGLSGSTCNVVACVLVDGDPTTIFAGVPGYTYVVQRTQDLTGTPTWTDLMTTNAPAGGLFQYTDLTPPEGNVFYRAINQ